MDLQNRKKQTEDQIMVLIVLTRTPAPAPCPRFNCASKVWYIPTAFPAPSLDSSEAWHPMIQELKLEMGKVHIIHYLLPVMGQQTGLEHCRDLWNPTEHCTHGILLKQLNCHFYGLTVLVTTVRKSTRVLVFSVGAMVLSGKKLDLEILP